MVTSRTLRPAVKPLEAARSPLLQPRNARLAEEEADIDGLRAAADEDLRYDPAAIGHAHALIVDCMVAML